MRYLMLFLALLAGCAQTHTPPAAPAPAAHDPTWLVGSWVTRQSETPLGPVPFVFDFRVEADGSVHAHTGNDQTFVDLRFVRTPEGTWRLDERAALPGVGEQAYSLVPAPDAANEWRAAGKPGFLTVRLTRQGENAMTFAVLLRGQPHVRFEMARRQATAMGR
jgi:hypothetical protein